MKKFRMVVLFLCSTLLLASSVAAQSELEVAFPNLSFTRPVDLQNSGDGTNRIFVVEQAGRIRVFENSSDASTASVFLDIRNRVRDNGNEEGLLGLAFHPDYENNGFFFVYHSASNPRRSVIARYNVNANNPNLADPNSQLAILEFNQPFSNHNGGQIAFGPDGYLYIASGDGGSGGDPQGNGQNRATLLGAILRIDVDNPEGGNNYGIPSDNPFAGNTAGFREEIYAYGLRNPWRFSFDVETGWLWAADVGQNRIEEVDIIDNGKNYGWNILEGSACYPSGTSCNRTGLEPPIWEYTHSLGQSITGGYVYRGSNVPELIGAYICGDFNSGRIWSVRYDGSSPAEAEELLRFNSFCISSFGVDENNELYLCCFDGRIYRFKPTTTSVETDDSLPTTFELQQNYPNPFNPTTTIKYNLSKPAHVELNIYNVEGQFVQSLVNAAKTPGAYSVIWDGTNKDGIKQASGVYLYRLKINGRFVETKRMILLR